jgi:hypothetical protein
MEPAVNPAPQANKKVEHGGLLRAHYHKCARASPESYVELRVCGLRCRSLSIIVIRSTARFAAGTEGFVKNRNREKLFRPGIGSPHT